MCGIAGLLRRDGSEVDAGLADRMADALAHRGPDDAGLWSASGVALAHRRLAIRDLSDAGAQPMHDNSGLVTVVYNGELYNAEELRRELENQHGYAFRGHCDTEILPAAYLAWGEQSFARLNGMFAFALWDSRTRALYLVRDRMGMKPLFFWDEHRPGQTAFASELKALLLGGRVPDIDADQLLTFLSQGYCDPTETYLAGVRQLAPGCWRRYRDGAVDEAAFASPRPAITIRRTDEAVAGFVDLFDRVVEDHLVADTPVASFQSGGIDGSLISSALGGSDATLLTARFADAAFDETPLARRVAAAVGIEHVCVDVTREASAVAGFRRTVHALDGQVADSSAYAVDRLCAATARDFKVVLSGDGADELFGGYATYRASRIAAATGAWVPARASRALASHLLGFAGGDESRYPRLQLIARFLSGWGHGRNAHARWRRYLWPRERAVLLTGEFDPAAKPFAGYEAALAAADSGAAAACLLADQTYYLPGDMLRKVDALSMAHSLEVRLPFLDPRVVEFARSVDANVLVPLLGESKPVLRQALRRRISDPTVTDAPKAGFNVPLSHMLRNELQAFAEQTLLDQADGIAQWIKPDGLRTIWREHQSGARDHGYLLWTVLTFATWYAMLRD